MAQDQTSTEVQGELVKLRTTVGALLDAFLLTAPTLDNKGASSNLYLLANETSGFLYLYSTNLLSETATKIKAEIETPGEALVHPGKLKDGLAGLGDATPVTLELTATGNQLKVSSGKVKFSLASSVDVKEMGNRMRSIPSKSAPISTIPAIELIEFTKRSVFCIPSDQTGQLANLAVLKMIDTEVGEEAFATDGSIVVHVSSIKKQSKGSVGTQGLLIPAAALSPLSGLVAKKRGQTIDVILTEKKNRVFFKFADGTYFGALTQSTAYPNLQPIVDQVPQYRFDISREEFRLALNRASAFINQGTVKKSLELEFGTDALKLRADGDDSLSDEIPITYTVDKPSETIRLGMNLGYLANIANGSRSKELTFGFTKENSPLIVIDKEGDDEDAINIKYVVMGTRLAAAR